VLIYHDEERHADRLGTEMWLENEDQGDKDQDCLVEGFANCWWWPGGGNSGLFRTEDVECVDEQVHVIFFQVASRCTFVAESWGGREEEESGKEWDERRPRGGPGQLRGNNQEQLEIRESSIFRKCRALSRGIPFTVHGLGCFVSLLSSSTMHSQKFISDQARLCDSA
jgi:hypothetical protein